MKFGIIGTGIWNAFSNIWKGFWAGFNSVLNFLKKYKDIYLLIGLFTRGKKYPETEKQYRYGIIICARNEHLVIGNLIDSIWAQTYDKDKLTVFVVADNCTDHTAQICRDKGCIVYERFDPQHARKGYAMEFLFDRIIEDYGIDSHDGYIVFDADNLLNPTFIEELNKAFATGAGIVVGYRNTKNFDTNFISAGYGIHFYQSVVTYHRPRCRLHLSTHIAGTGFVMASRLLKDGWHYTCLTEDTQFTLNSVAQGEYIAFCEDAEFFDEQPYEVKVMARQRIRWIRGRLYSFFSTLSGLVRGIFTNGIRKAFSCYDMIIYSFPHSTYNGLRLLLFPFVKGVIRLGASLALGHALGIGAGSKTSQPLWLALWVLFTNNVWEIIKMELSGIVVVVRERRHIRCSTPKLIWYTLLFPWFDLIGGPLSIIALVSKSQWKPIKHDEAFTIEDMGIKSKNRDKIKK